VAASIIPIILAGGASTRMGRVKALCELGGQTCLELALAACRPRSDVPELRRSIVVLGHASREVAARVDLGAVDVVINRRPERGQTSSLQEGLRVLPPGADAFLVYPVDFPLIQPQDVARLIAAFRTRPAGVHVVVPSHAGRRGHPALFAAALGDEILALPDGGSARDVLAAHAAAILHVGYDTDRVITDMDTPEDYERIRTRFR